MSVCVSGFDFHPVPVDWSPVASLSGFDGPLSDFDSIGNR